MKAKTKTASLRKTAPRRMHHRRKTGGKRMSTNPQPNNGTPAARPDAAADNAESGGNVDKIRELIFGTQMRDYDT